MLAGTSSRATSPRVLRNSLRTGPTRRIAIPASHSSSCSRFWPSRSWVGRTRRHGFGLGFARSSTSWSGLHATRCPDGTLIRNRYFTGKFLSAADLEQEQDYVRTKQRRHNRLLHGVGIVRGLEVSVEPREPGEDPVVVVSPGVAIDPQGEELVVCERVDACLCSGKAICYVTVRLAERPTNVMAGGEASRIEESAEISVIDDVPAGDLAIARLVRDGDAWLPDATFEPARVGL